MASALLRGGPDHVRSMLDELAAWMEEREYESVHQLRGSMSMANVPNPIAYARANYAQPRHVLRERVRLARGRDRGPDPTLGSSHIGAHAAPVGSSVMDTDRTPHTDPRRLPIG